MAILETIKLDNQFPFRFLINYGYRLTTPHFHSEYEIIYVKKGAINLGVNDYLYKLKEGQIFIINSHVEHYIVPEIDSVRYIYQFNNSLFGNLLLQDGLINLNEICHNSEYWDDQSKKTILKLLDEIKYEVEENKKGYQLQVVGDLLQIIVILMRGTYDKNDIFIENKKMRNLQKIFKYVEDNYQYHIYIEDVAEHAGYNTEYFSRFFKKNTGLSFTDFLLDYRVTKAKWDLITTDKSINQIIYNNGFTNTSTFYRNFKEITGYSPKEYRNKYDK